MDALEDAERHLEAELRLSFTGLQFAGLSFFRLAFAGLGFDG
jgi:hypothetical protein